MESLILDPAKWSELVELERDGNPGLVEQITSVFFAEVEASLIVIERAVALGDSSTVVAESHKLKSSSGSLGAFRLCLHCREMEALGKTGELNQVGPLLEGARAEFHLFRAAARQKMG